MTAGGRGKKQVPNQVAGHRGEEPSVAGRGEEGQVQHHVASGRGKHHMLQRVQGYLAHKKAPPLIGPPYAFRHTTTAGS